MLAANTWTLRLSGTEANAAANQQFAISIYVLTSGDTVRGYVYDSATAVGTEFATSATSRIFTVSGSQVSGVVATDKLVVEVWAKGQESGSAGARVITVTFNGPTDPINNTAQATPAANIETPQDSLFVSTYTKDGAGRSVANAAGSRAGSTLNKAGDAYSAGQAGGVKDYTPGQVQVTVNSTAPNQGPFTVPAGLTDGYLVATILNQNKARSLTSVRWGNSGPYFTKLVRYSAVLASWEVEIWGLANPPAGSDGTVLLYDDSSTSGSGMLILLEHAHQTVQNGGTGGTDDSGHSLAPTGSSLTVPAGGLEVGFLWSTGSAATVTDGTKQLDDGGGDGIATRTTSGYVAWGGAPGQWVVTSAVILPTGAATIDKLGGAVSSGQASGSRAGSTLNRGGAGYSASQASGTRGREVSKAGGAYTAAQASGSRAGSTLNRFGAAYSAAQASGEKTLGREVPKQGGAYSAGQASGSHAGSTFNRSGAAYSAAQAAGAKTRERGETGSAYSSGQAAGSRAGSTLNRSGSARSALVGAGSRARDAVRSGEARSVLTADGVQEVTPGSQEIQKQGGAYTAATASGVRGREASKAGSAYSSAAAAGIRGREASKQGGAYGALTATGTRAGSTLGRAGAGVSAAQAAGLRGREAARQGSVASTLTASGTRAGSTLNRSGSARSVLTASGDKQVESPGRYDKLGGAMSSLSASGVRQVTYDRSGAAASTISASGTRTRIAARDGGATTTLTASGASSATRNRAGAAYTTSQATGLRGYEANRAGGAYSALTATGYVPMIVTHWPLLRTTETRPIVLSTGELVARPVDNGEMMPG